MAGVRSLEIVIRAVDRVTPVTRRVSKSLLRVGKAARRVGRSMTTALTLPIGLATAGVVKYAADFETAMTRVNALVGIQKDEVTKLGKALLKLAPQVGVGPAELAKSLFFITSGGIRDPASAFEATSVAAKASAIGIGTAAESANVLTTVMNAYESSLGSAEEAMGVLLGTVREGKFPIDQLGQGVSQFIAIASVAEIPVRDIMSAFASITRVTGDAPRAATLVRGFVTQMLKLKGGRLKLFERLGFNQREVLADLKKKGGLFKFLEQLRTRTGRDAVILSGIFENIRAFGGISVLLGDSFEKNLISYSRLAQDDAKTFQDTWEAFEATFMVKFTKSLAKAQVAMLNFGIVIGPSLLPIIDSLAESIEQVSWWFEQLIPSSRRWVFVMLGMLFIGGPLLSMFGFMAIGLAGLGITATSVAGAFAFMWTSILLPVFGVAGAITVLIVAFGLLAGFILSRFEPVRELFQWMYDFIIHGPIAFTTVGLDTFAALGGATSREDNYKPFETTINIQVDPVTGVARVEREGDDVGVFEIISGMSFGWNM